MITLDDKTTEKPVIEYPTEWGYKLIGKDLDALLKCIKETMNDKEHTTRSGNVSKAGKYHSHNVSCMVLSQEERDAIFKAFQDHESVEMVI